MSREVLTVISLKSVSFILSLVRAVLLCTLLLMEGRALSSWHKGFKTRSFQFREDLQKNPVVLLGGSCQSHALLGATCDSFLYNSFVFPDNVLPMGGEFCYFIWTFILCWFLTYPVQVSMGWFDIIYILRLLWRNCIRFKKQI